jgi:ABC-type Fe3+ transport system substrate-binding protein
MNARAPWLAAIAVLLAAGAAAALEMPPTLKKVMEERRLDPALLDGLDAELALPQAIIDGARREGKVSLRMTIPPRQFEQVKAAFNERYPFVKVEYLTAVGRDRATAPLIALKAGNYLSDVITGFGVVHDEFVKMDGLVDLRGLPAYGSVMPFMNTEDGRATAAQTNYWCTAYNSQKVKKAELPATWDELVDNPRWRNGVVGMANRPQVWLAHLWGTMGEAWTQSIMTRIFRDLRPQLRHESITALPKLASIGEFDMAVPAGDFLLRGYVNQGMPLGFHCPEPVPLSFTGLGLLKGSPNPNAALLITNWMLSREGQILFFHFVEAVPTHRGLQIPALLPFPDEIKGKKIAPRTNETEAHQAELLQDWTRLWQGAGGPKEEAR